MSKRSASVKAGKRGRSLRPRASQRGSDLERAQTSDAPPSLLPSTPPEASVEAARKASPSLTPTITIEESGPASAPPEAIAETEKKASPSLTPTITIEGGGPDSEPSASASEAPREARGEAPTVSIGESNAEREAAAAELEVVKAANEEAATETAGAEEDDAAEAKSEGATEADEAAEAKADEAAEAKADEAAEAKADEAAEAKADVAKTNDPVAKTEEADASEASDDEAPSSRRGDDLDDLSVSSEFFRTEEDSVPPVDSTAGDHDDHEEVPRHLRVTPEAIARRARLRRVVGGVVAVAALISVVVIGKSLSGTKKPVAEPAVVAVVTETPEAAKPEAAPEVAAPAPTAEPAPTASAEPASEGDAAAAAPSASAEVEAAAAPSSDEAAALKKEALGLLNRGKRTEAIEVSKRLIQADPSDAMGYLYLGSALQESGKWKEGVAAYSECVRHATKGPVYECRAMGGKK